MGTDATRLRARAKDYTRKLLEDLRDAHAGLLAEGFDDDDFKTIGIEAGVSFTAVTLAEVIGQVKKFSRADTHKLAGEIHKRTLEIHKDIILRHGGSVCHIDPPKKPKTEG